MSINVRKHLDVAVYRMMFPIARFLLRFGMTANEFTNLCRSAFVHAAAEKFTQAGKKPNQSRIAVTTGLTRHQVGEYLERDWQEVRSYEFHRHRTTRVLSNWHQDPDFVDKEGKPLTLDFEGEGSTFQALGAAMIAVASSYSSATLGRSMAAILAYGREAGVSILSFRIIKKFKDHKQSDRGLA